MAASMKNWEAQAKTNSILAGSLKALEERVDDVSILLEWRNEIEARFEEMVDSVSEVRDQVVDIEAKSKKKDKQNTFWRSLSGAGGAVVPAGAGGASTDAAKETGVPVSDKSMKYRCMYAFEGGLYRPLSFVTFVLQGVLGCGMMVEVGEADDFTTRFLAGLLGVCAILGCLFGMLAITKEYKFAQNLVMAWAVWVVAQSAVFMQTSIREYGKNDRFCSITGIPGIPDGDCSSREGRAQVKIFYSIAMAVLEVFAVLAMLHFKDKRLRGTGDFVMARAPGAPGAGGGQMQNFKALSFAARNESRLRISRSTVSRTPADSFVEPPALAGPSQSPSI